MEVLQQPLGERIAMIVLDESVVLGDLKPITPEKEKIPATT
jgi:hypothetical protein